MNINKITLIINMAKKYYHEGKSDVADTLLDAFVDEMEIVNARIDRMIAHYDNGDDYMEEEKNENG